MQRLCDRGIYIYIYIYIYKSRGYIPFSNNLFHPYVLVVSYLFNEPAAAWFIHRKKFVSSSFINAEYRVAEIR